MPLTKLKGVVENWKQKKHAHTCTKCGRVWTCNLQIDPEDRERWLKEKARKVCQCEDKVDLQCWWDVDTDCVKCEGAGAA